MTAMLQVNSKDTVDTQRKSMIKHIYDLLLEKPEQERTLLSLIINKLVFYSSAVLSKE